MAWSALVDTFSQSGRRTGKGDDGNRCTILVGGESGAILPRPLFVLNATGPRFGRTQEKADAGQSV
jgi:hypothetical protein